MSKIRDLAFLLCGALLLALFLDQRFVSDRLLNVDELIPLELSKMMVATGNLDPNWNEADLPPYLRYDQYNFYFFNILAHFAILAGKQLDVPALESVRYLNIAFQLVSAWLIGDTVRRLGLARSAQLMAMAAATVFPLLVQDAGMARPESLVHFIMALLGWVCVAISHRRIGPWVIGVLMGLGVAVKFSFAVFAAPLAMVWFIGHERAEIRPAIRALIAALLGLICGLLAGMPYAFINPDVYFHGFKYLMGQYSTEHPPHSNPEASFFSQLTWITGYFATTSGMFLWFTIGLSAVSKQARALCAFWFVLPWIALMMYFSTKPVFFERNFSQAIAPLCVAFGICADIARRRLPGVSGFALVAIALVSLAQMTHWSEQIRFFVEEGPARREGFESKAGVQGFEPVDFGDSFTRKQFLCGSLALIDYNDPWSRDQISALKHQGFKLSAQYHSPFEIIPTSTLHTYLDADVHYLVKPCD